MQGMNGRLGLWAVDLTGLKIFFNINENCGIKFFLVIVALTRLYQIAKSSLIIFFFQQSGFTLGQYKLGVDSTVIRRFSYFRNEKTFIQILTIRFAYYAGVYYFC